MNPQYHGIIELNVLDRWGERSHVYSGITDERLLTQRESYKVEEFDVDNLPKRLFEPYRELILNISQGGEIERTRRINLRELIGEIFYNPQLVWRLPTLFRKSRSGFL